MKNKIDYPFILKLMFYIYLIFFYSNIALLGKSLLHVEKIGEAVSILQTSNLFFVRALRVIISNKKAWYFTLVPLVREISLIYLMMSFLWITLNDNRVFRMWSYTIMLPLVINVIVLFAINQNSIKIGFLIAQYLGYFILIYALLMMLISFMYFIQTTRKSHY